MVLRPNVDPSLCFVLMPFNDLHNTYFSGILAPAVESSGLRAVKADQIYGTGAIIQDIWRLIWSAQVVIADVTGRNPNVNYELGLCHALGVPTILISQDISDVPFDYRHRRCILYETKRVDWQRKLGDDIRETIKAVLSGSAGKEELEWPYDAKEIESFGTSQPFVPSELAREPVLNGISQAQDALSMALGPHGASLLSSKMAFGGRPSRNGVAISSALGSNDPLTQLGMDQVRELSREISAELGDGTKSAALLFCEMVKGGYETLATGILLRDLITEMDVAVESAVSFISTISRPASDKTVSAVALCAALGNALDGHVAVSAMNNAGADGVVYLEDSLGISTDLLIREGMHFNKGFISDKFITDEPRQLAILNNAHILLCDFKLNSMQYLLPILEQIVFAKQGNSLLVIADDIEGEVLAILEVNLKKGTFSSVPVKFMSHGAGREMILEDIAVASGGSVISHSNVLLNTKISQLGFAKSVEVSRDNTWLIGPSGDPKLVEQRAAGIRQQISVAGSGTFGTERLHERLASLVGATVAIRVGGASETDRADRKARISSALSSARQTLSQGAVIGGGNSLWQAGNLLAKSSLNSGAKIIVQALESPLRAQVKNSRLSFDEIVRVLNENSDKDIGFDAIKRQVTNLVDAQVLDATRVVIRSLQIAFARARNVLQTGAWEVISPQVIVQ